jgi:hypothetical protein
MSIDFGMSRVWGILQQEGAWQKACFGQVPFFGAGIVDNTATHVRSGFERSLF